VVRVPPSPEHRAGSEGPAGGLSIAIFDGRESDATTRLPSSTLCEEDVASVRDRHPAVRFLKRYVLGHNEMLRFVMARKSPVGRWGLLLFLYDFLSSVSGVIFISNILSSLPILLPLLVLRPHSSLLGLLCFSAGWLLASLLSLPRSILPSYLLLGLLLPPSTPLGPLLLALAAGSLLCSGLASLLLSARLPCLLLPLLLLHLLLPLPGPALPLGPTPPPPGHTTEDAAAPWDTEGEASLDIGPDAAALTNSTAPSLPLALLLSTLQAPGRLYGLPDLLPSLAVTAALLVFSPLLTLFCLQAAPVQ
jgi:hypothetical protein